MGLGGLPLLIALPLGVVLAFVSRCQAMWALFIGSGLLLVGLTGRLVVQMSPCGVGTFTPPPGGCYSRETMPALLVGVELLLGGLAAGAWYTKRAANEQPDR